MSGFLFVGLAMSVTDQAIENLAASFCLLSKPEHKAMYLEALQSIKRIAQAELVFQMELAFVKATTGPSVKH
jgi:hypothetical protein